MYAVIDIGSNSVRLMLHDGEKSVSKAVCSTKLAEGIINSSELSMVAIKRTADAIIDFVGKARAESDDVMIFATEAVRRATNSHILIDMVFGATGLNIDVITGELEAKLGYVGVSQSGICTVVDIGGASTEIIVGNSGVIEYAKSVRMGGVVLRDECGEDSVKLDESIDSTLLGFTSIPYSGSVIAIGGTATTTAALIHEVQPYDPEIIHGAMIDKESLGSLIKRIRGLSMQDRRGLKGMFIGREDIIIGAMTALYKVMELLKVESVTVSESDNLEGYLMLKRIDKL